MTEKQANKIRVKIFALEQEVNRLIQKYNTLYRDKPMFYRVRAAMVKKEMFDKNGELAAWRAKLGIGDD